MIKKKLAIIMKEHGGLAMASIVMIKTITGMPYMP